MGSWCSAGITRCWDAREGRRSGGLEMQMALGVLLVLRDKERGWLDSYATGFF